MTVRARYLRAGDQIVHHGVQVTVKETDNVDGFIEIVTECGRMFYVRWNRVYLVERKS